MKVKPGDYIKFVGRCSGYIYYAKIVEVNDIALDLKMSEPSHRKGVKGHHLNDEPNCVHRVHLRDFKKLKAKIIPKNEYIAAEIMEQ